MIKQNRNIELTPVSPEPLNVSALSKTDGLIRYATYNMAGNGKAPDSRTGIVLKSGAKVLRYF